MSADRWLFVVFRSGFIGLFGLKMAYNNEKTYKKFCASKKYCTFAASIFTLKTI